MLRGLSLSAVVAGFVAVGALEPRFYAALIKGLGLTPDEAPQFDRENWPALQARFTALFATRDRDDWAAHFAGTEACVTPVLTLAEAKAAFKKGPGLASIYGSNEVVEKFNIDNKVYEKPQVVADYIAPAITEGM